MEYIIKLLEHPTSNATLIIIVAIIIIVPNFPKIAKYIPFLRAVTSDKVDYEKIATNHMHQMTEVVEKLTIIDGKIDKMSDKMSLHGERISKLEGLLDK